jgi:hypothetical protein
MMQHREKRDSAETPSLELQLGAITAQHRDVRPCQPSSQLRRE